MRTLSIVVVGLSLLFATGCGSKPDQQAIQGTWTIESGEMNGKAAPPGELVKSRFVFAAEKVVIEDGDGKDEETYKLDPNPKPKTIDMTTTIKHIAFGTVVAPAIGAKATASAPAVKPEDKVVKTEKKTVKGIYSLDGDTLKLCLAEPEGPRPMEFTSANGQFLIVLKRAK